MRERERKARTRLLLAFIAEHYSELATQAAHKQWSHLDYLGHLVEGEALLRQDRCCKHTDAHGL